MASAHNHLAELLLRSHGVQDDQISWHQTTDGSAYLQFPAEAWLTESAVNSDLTC